MCDFVLLLPWSYIPPFLHLKLEHEMPLPLKVCTKVVRACSLVQLPAGIAAYAVFSHLNSLLCGRRFY